jgi:hypothetical protein
MAFPDLPSGTVLKLFVTDTNPPKIKRFIIIGYSGDKLQLATIYINTQINRRFSWSIELECLQYKVEAITRPYLDHDSWIDCSELIIRPASEISNIVKERPEAIIGKLSDGDFKVVIDLLQTSPKIKGKIKKRFGLYN